MEEKEASEKEKRIRNLTQLYYSKPEIQKTLFEFSKNRETIPRYFEGFGKRPDSFQYKGDILELVKKGATSFHASEELWSDPLKIETGMNEKQLNEIRIGWDLLIDIDSKYLDYSKIAAQVIINMLKFHGIKNVGIKFSGSKGFHLIIPSKAFPKKINNIEISEKFPDVPRILTKYIMEKTQKQLIQKISELEQPSKYIKDFSVSEKVMPDIILVSPRHLFRMPYSLHEKTALASVVLTEEELENFQPKFADPLKVKVRDFIPNSKQGEASELLIPALDWNKDNSPDEKEKKDFEFKEIKLENLSEEFFPPTIRKILLGVGDGRKRALFVLINFFRCLGIEKQELEQRIYSWNEKNEIPLLEGYVKTQLQWSYRKKPILPPNFDKDYYKGVGAIPSEEELKLKNPVSYTIKKTLSSNRKYSKK